MGDATLCAAMHRGLFVFANLWGRWLRWAGHHWADDIDSERALAAVERVCEEHERILVEHDKARDPDSDLAKAVRKRLNVPRDRAGRENLLELAHTIDEPLSVMAAQFDRQEYLLACPDAVVDPRTGEDSPGRPDQYILNACPTPWAGLDNQSQAFMDFLHSCFDGDEEMVRFILRLLGYALVGNRNDHIWVIFHGPRGRNGKDTLMRIIFLILGEALARKVPTAMLLQQTFQRSSSQPEPDLIALRGAKVAFANEGETDQKIAMSRLKCLTGGSVLSARGINDKHMTTWQQTHLLFFLTNELPTMRAGDDAFWTRVMPCAGRSASSTIRRPRMNGFGIRTWPAGWSGRPRGSWPVWWPGPWIIWKTASTRRTRSSTTHPGAAGSVRLHRPVPARVLRCGRDAFGRRRLENQGQRHLSHRRLQLVVQKRAWGTRTRIRRNA